MSDVHKQVADQAASEIISTFKALRKDGISPKRALELARIRARQHAEERAKARTEIGAAWSSARFAAGTGSAASAVYDFLSGVWSFVNAKADRPGSIGATANASFRELMVLYSPNPRDRIHAEVKRDGGYLRIDVLDHESDFVIKDWTWNLLKAFRQETGSVGMPSDGLVRLNDALEIGFGLSSRWNAHCWRLRLLFKDSEEESAETVSRIFGLVSAKPDVANEEIFLPGERTEIWEPAEHRTVVRQAESSDGTVKVTVFIDDSGGTS